MEKSIEMHAAKNKLNTHTLAYIHMHVHRNLTVIEHTYTYTNANENETCSVMSAKDTGYRTHKDMSGCAKVSEIFSFLGSTYTDKRAMMHHGFIV